jgi:ketosteroid isomerase-like protein
MSQERVEHVLAGYAAFNRGDLDAALDGLSEHVEWVVLGDLLDQGPFVGHAGVRRFWEMWRESFDVFEIEIEDSSDLDEHVLVSVQIRARGRGSSADVPNPAFVQLWSWRGDEIVRVQMFPSAEAALAAFRDSSGDTSRDSSRYSPEASRSPRRA